ncbi:hypothetical protein CVT24_002582 [Panaeolus cyanescens]|uniref:Carrier domain-containing protein n=1 Tax=Panaeolus cyanescens TaxID=181874 RepID=A0A409WB61_9AGAR|nr:hypothetical protein CVT24_002582 [Panaeolus cyanescens]
MSEIPERRTLGGRLLPPAFGTVTLPECVDFHTTHNPTHPIYCFSQDGESEITNITHLEFGRACDRLAHRVRPGRQGPDDEVVAVVALSDTLLYQTATIGLIRAGLRPFLMSPRATPEMILSMMKDSSCSRILTTEKTLQPLISGIRAQFPKNHPNGPELVVEEMPPLDEIYPKLGRETAEDPFEPYPKAANKPPLDNVMLYLHSSGSTGMPKTIPHTYRSMIQWGSFELVDFMRTRNPQTVLGGMPLPSFHTMGIVAQLINPMYSLAISAIYPPTATTPGSLPVMPTPDNILDHIRRTKSNGIVMVPALIHLWAQDKANLEFLATLSFIISGGAPMPPKTGNLLVKAGVQLTSVYGGTEIGCISVPFSNTEGPEDWEYTAFDNSLNIRWDPQGDGTFELQFLACENHHLPIQNMPGEQGYATSDIWVPHPTNPKLWKIVGRKDDVIMHASGEKTVPAPMENVLLTSPYIAAAIYFGRQKDQPGILVELAPSRAVDTTNQAEVIKARNLIWPIVEEANKLAPGFSKVFKELILFSSPGKPLPRSAKGTVMRKAALAAYNDEIEAIYAEVNSSSNTASVQPPEDWSKEKIQPWLLQQLEDLVPGKSFVPTVDLMEQGLDSLGVTILRRRISAGLQAAQLSDIATHITPNVLYQHPSLEKLSTFLSTFIADPASFFSSMNRVENVEKMIEKHSHGLDFRVAESTNSSGKICVLITGTTGSLGAYLLDSFLHNPEVHTVYAYNRPSEKQSLLQRHQSRFVEVGLDEAGLRSPKIKFLEGDLNQPRLGLDQAAYDELLENLTVIVHNAWTVNFNLSLSSFESNIAGTRQLIDLARDCRHGSSTRFIFTSSISSAYSWDQTRGPYPEEVILDARYSVGIGYGESKYVCERILERSGIQGTTIRIGQISGGQPSGAWATTDWVPILVKSSVAMGVLPSMSGVTSWIPMHTISQGILDVALSQDITAAYNFVHPKPVQWEILIKHVNSALVQQSIVKEQLSVVPFGEWLAKLEVQVSNATSNLIERIPAIKLVDFFRGLNASISAASATGPVTEAAGGPLFATKKAQQISEGIANLPPLSDEDASLWIKYWKSTGFIN